MAPQPPPSASLAPPADDLEALLERCRTPSPAALADKKKTKSAKGTTKRNNRNGSTRRPPRHPPPRPSSSSSSQQQQPVSGTSLSASTRTASSTSTIASSSSREDEFLERYRKEVEEDYKRLVDKFKKENDMGHRRTHSYASSVDSSDDPTNGHNNDLSLSSPGKPKKQQSILLAPLKRFCRNLEVFVSNVPLTVGALGLSWVTVGVIWFKFMEEMVDFCTPVHYRSNRCTYPEFPGCFECDRDNLLYWMVNTLHYACNGIGALCCLLFFGKCLLAWQIVWDELKNPATSTPVGVVCITVIIVSAGRGWPGQLVVVLTSIFHLALAFWFLYTAVVQFRLWPDPGWYPNTVGISYAAIKTWLYYPTAGYILMTMAMICLYVLYPITLYRVAMNPKIAAPVCFIQLSAPSITMYSMTIMAQTATAGKEALIQDSDLAARAFHHLHQRYYLPLQHFMMILSLLGMVSVLHSLVVRWPKFKYREFTPAHIAFVFPLLSHTNSVQAYRSSVIAFGSHAPKSHFMVALWTYWFVCLLVGTSVCLIFTYKYVTKLPEWTFADLGAEEEPVPPDQTIMHEMLTEMGEGLHETIRQPLVNPAVLQANEAGTMIRLPRGTADWNTRGPYVRTRKVTALGFDLILSELELRQERAELLDWVAKNAPRKRSKTLSFDLYGTFGSIIHNDNNNINNGSGQQAGSRATKAAGHQRSRTVAN